ncbi:peptidoglycan-binding protein [Oxalobacteraceae bacterium]|nr:peptidoglycan-binding protein [Oxalobacteraceae bacterium]
MSMQAKSEPAQARQCSVPASQLKAAEAAADGSSASAPADAPIAACPLLRYAVEACVVGEDDKPLSDVAVELRAGADRALRAKTSADGMVRFEGLQTGSLELSLYELDEEAWVLEGSEALPARLARSDGDAAWLAPVAVGSQSRVHVVAQGECTAKLASRHGFFPDTVWNWPDNAALKTLRKDKNVLFPGDRLCIPARRMGSVAANSGQRLRLRRKGVPDTLHIRFLVDGQPRRQLPYLASVTHVDGVQAADCRGVTDENGYVLMHVMPEAHTVSITLGSGAEAEVHTILIGVLDPVTECLGVQKRLANLGLYDGPLDGQQGSGLERALARFQLTQGLDVSCRLDEATLRALRDFHLS